jgi:NADP-dependent 3-hydroxy acid dehydrogenase YdfG
MSGYSRIAIVTGATSGIGEATARKFIAAGFGVIGNGRNAARLGELERELGSAFRGVAGDAGSAALVDELFAASSRHFGKPATIVVANAGRGLNGSVKDADLSQLEEMLRTNVTGVTLLLQRAARELVPLQEKAFPGSAADIVVLGSVVGRNISPFGAVYSASKFAVHGLTESLRREIGPKGVRVSLVEPGVVVSGFQAAAGYGEETTKLFNDRFGPLLYGTEIADAIHFVVTQPPHVHVSDIVVRPTRQDYP